MGIQIVARIMGTLITKEPTWANYHHIETREEYRAAKIEFLLLSDSFPDFFLYQFSYTPGTGKEYGVAEWLTGDVPLAAPQPADSASFFNDIQWGINQYLGRRENKDNWKALGYSWPAIRATTWYNFCVDIAGLTDGVDWGYRYLEDGDKIADLKWGNGLQYSDTFATSGIHYSGVWLLEDLKLAYDALEEYFPWTAFRSGSSSDTEAPATSASSGSSPTVSYSSQESPFAPTDTPLPETSELFTSIVLPLTSGVSSISPPSGFSAP